MNLAQQWQMPLGNILVATGEHRCRGIYSDFSQSLHLPLLDLASLDKNPKIETEKQLDYLLQNQLVLLQEYPTPLYASASLDVPQDPRSRHPLLAAGRFAAVVTPRDHRAFFLSRYRKTLSARATIKLAKWAPEFSARKRMSLAQMLVVVMVCIFSGLFAAHWLNGAIIAANLFFSIWFFALIALRAAALAYAPVHERLNRHKTAPVFDQGDLPIYTILVAMYRESAVVGQLTTALKALDYPAAKLDIKLLFEADDQHTIDTAKALNLPDNFEIIVVPHALPKTKPKALNLGLQFARGEYLAVYDAEDIPEPGQLQEALAAFARGPDTLACVQARLNFYNPQDNWLTRQFTVEYSVLFDVMLPFLKKLKKKPSIIFGPGSSNARGGSRAGCKPISSICAIPYNSIRILEPEGLLGFR